MKDKDAKILEEAYNKINEREEKPGPYDYPPWKEDEWYRDEEPSKPMQGMAFIQDETSSKPKRVDVRVNEDGTFTLRFDNSYTISHADRKGIQNLIDTLEGLL